MDRQTDRHTTEVVFVQPADTHGPAVK